jgi:diacylglycerol kinase family enzyme
LLDVLFFADLSKSDLLGYVFQGVGIGKPEDPRIQHFHVRQVEIATRPAMPVMADGNAVGEGLVRIRVRRHALTVMAGEPTPGMLPARGAVHDEPTGESTKRKEIALS